RTPELEAFWTMCADRMVRRAKMTLAETRESFDNEMGAVPLAPDCTVENFDLDGLPVEKITPKGAPADKVLLYLHGGGHIFGSIRSHRHYVSRLAAAADVTAFHIDYRLAPEHPYPAAIEDALNAYQHLLKQGIKPENLIVGGESAGGNLAAALLLTLKDKGLPQPAGVYLLSPWLDMTTTADSYTRVGTRDPMITRAGIDGVAAAYLGGQPDNPITSP
ncbi:MAG: alpha/beta hydrolase, partial [Caldilineaceae bacterium]|nr:alpha/beta hydrolase [Caldilineaceae bacterium]